MLSVRNYIFLMNKFCPCCQADLPIENFYSSKTKTSSKCKQCSRKKQKIWDAANRARKLEINRQWRKRNLSRRKMMMDACNKLWRAIRAGKIIRGTVCQQCGGSQRIEASHEDYSKPFEVSWLCTSCHRIWNSKFPKTISVEKSP